MKKIVKAKVKPSKKPKPKAKSAVKKGSVTRNLESVWGIEFTENRLVKDMNEDLKDAWEKIREFATSLGPQRIYASPLAIMFAKKVCYFYVRPKKKYLEVWIFLPRAIDGLIAQNSATKKVKFQNLYKVHHADQVEEPLTDWLKEAWDFAPEE